MKENKNLENINKLISSDEYMKRILLANNVDDAKQVFKEANVDVSDTQIQNFRDCFSNNIKKLNEISDCDLEEINGGTGGYNTTRTLHAAQAGVGYGGAYGMWVGAGIGAAAGVVDASIKAYKGQISSTWDFLKEAFKISVKASLVGGAAGAVEGLISGSLLDIGDQGYKNLSENKKQTQD